MIISILLNCKLINNCINSISSISINNYEDNLDGIYDIVFVNFVQIIIFLLITYDLRVKIKSFYINNKN